MIYGLDYGLDYVLDYDIDYGIDLSQIYTQKLLLCNYLNQNPNPNTQKIKILNPKPNHSFLG
jgi:hypothetical protein